MWYIVSYNQIQGFVAGSFQDIEMLFLAGLDFETEEGWPSFKWAGLISEAKGFETHEAARKYAYANWGKRHTDQCFMIAEFNVDGSSFAQSEEISRRLRDKFDGFTRRLVMNEVEGAQLTCMAEKLSYDTPLTWREKQIIKIMSEYSRSRYG